MSITLQTIGKLAALGLAVAGVGVLAALTPTEPPHLRVPRVTLPDHDGQTVLFAPGGRMMLTDGASGGCLRDVATGRILVRLFEHQEGRPPSPITQITWPRFTADGRHLLVQIGGPRFQPRSVHTVTLAVFDVASGRQLARFEDVGLDEWYGSSLPPPEYAVSADGSTLAFCQVFKDPARRNAQITVWDLERNQRLAGFEGVSPLGLSPRGDLIAHALAGSPESPPTMRRIRPARPGPAPGRNTLAEFPGLGAGAVVFTDDSRRVATIDPAGKPAFWDVLPDLGPAPWSPPPPATVANQASPSAQWHQRQGLRFRPDGRLLLVDDPGGYGNPAASEVWDLSGPAPRLTLKISAESLAPVAGLVATTEYDMSSRWNPAARDNSTVQIVSIPGGQTLRSFIETGVHRSTLAPDGRLLALPSLWDEVPRTTWWTQTVDWILGVVGLGRRAMVLPQLWPGRRDIQLRDAATNRLVATIDGAGWGPGLPDVEFSPDGKTLVVRTSPQSLLIDSDNPMIDWKVDLWDVPTGRPVPWGIPWVFASATLALTLVGLGLDGWRRPGRAG